MCGIAGFLAEIESESDRELEDRLERMIATLAHRGPDGSGLWMDRTAGIALGHRRLAVLDTSNAGRQPMISADGRFVITFNGEIYNHADIRERLRSVFRGEWRGHSDTEVLLEAIAAWGVERCLELVVGMFAFALWDRQESSLYLARDRMGEKPLYYGWLDQRFVFASELKALTVASMSRPSISRDALALFAQFSYIPAPYSIYEKIQKLIPGTYIVVPGTVSPGALPKVHKYWSALAYAQAPRDQIVDEDAAVERLQNLLDDAIGQQMIADVPVGAFLSGGIDSSTVVAIMQKHSARPVKTFTIGFVNRDFDEAQAAAKVARHIGTDHTELYVSAEDTLNIIPQLPTIYDEPLADSSQIPTFLVSRLARESVTVSLSGDGGDELFFGYNHYALADRMERWVGLVPSPLRRPIHGLGRSRFLQQALTRTLGGRKCERIRHALRLVESESPDERYQRMLELWDDHPTLVKGGDYRAFLADMRLPLRSLSRHNSYMALDILSYLPDSILAKVDRAAMAVSLETRIPLLDHRIVEFALSLPIDMKCNKRRKWLLRKLAYRHIPMELIDRPKQGFAVPLGQWLRHDLRDWAADLIGDLDGPCAGYFDDAAIRQRWQEHLSGNWDWHRSLWSILMFLSWYRAQLQSRFAT